MSENFMVGTSIDSLSLYVCRSIIASPWPHHGQEVNVSRALDALRETAHELNGSHWTERVTPERNSSWGCGIPMRNSRL